MMPSFTEDSDPQYIQGMMAVFLNSEYEMKTPTIDTDMNTAQRLSGWNVHARKEIEGEAYKEMRNNGYGQHGVENFMNAFVGILGLLFVVLAIIGAVTS